MLGVDTNVLVRFLAGDDAVQSPLATRLVTDPANQPIHVSLLVLMEAYRVLSRVHKVPGKTLDEAFSMLLSSPDFIVERSGLAAGALEAAATHGCDFSDALIALVNEDAGCVATATFDRSAQKLPGMIAVKDKA